MRLRRCGLKGVALLYFVLDNYERRSTQSTTIVHKNFPNSRRALAQVRHRFSAKILLTSCFSADKVLTLLSEMTALWFEAMPSVWLPCKDWSEVTFAVATPVAEDFISPFSQSVANSFNLGILSYPTIFPSQAS